MQTVVETPVGVAFLVVGGILAAVLLVAFAIAGVYALVSFSQWIVDARLRGLEPDKPGREHNESLAGTIATEVVSAGALFALHPLGAIDPAPPAERILRSGRPILLVPGYLQARSTFVLLGPRLSGLGLGPLYTINLPALEGGLDHQARILSERIDQIRRATASPQIDVVAHSTGGLVARIAEAGRKTPRIRRLVTLGTPHHGTQLAHVFLGSVARDMRPGSSVLRRLAPPHPGQLVSISSAHDFLVVPSESARVAPEGRDILVRHVGHMALLTDGEVAIEVAKALGEDIQIRRAQDLFERVETPEPELAAQPRVASMRP